MKNRYITTIFNILQLSSHMFTLCTLPSSREEERECVAMLFKCFAPSVISQELLDLERALHARTERICARLIETYKIIYLQSSSVHWVSQKECCKTRGRNEKISSFYWWWKLPMMVMDRTMERTMDRQSLRPWTNLEVCVVGGLQQKTIKNGSGSFMSFIVF